MDGLRAIEGPNTRVKVRLPGFPGVPLKTTSHFSQTRSKTGGAGAPRRPRPENEHDLTHSVGEWDQKRRRSILFDWFGAHLLQRQVPVKVVPNRYAHSRGWSSILAKCRKS